MRTLIMAACAAATVALAAHSPASARTKYPPVPACQRAGICFCNLRCTGGGANTQCSYVCHRIGSTSKTAETRSGGHRPGGGHKH